MMDSTEQQWQSSSKVVLTKYDRQLSIRNMKNFLRFWSLGGWLDTSELDKLKTAHDFDCYFHWRQLVQMAGLGHRGTKINFNALVSAVLKKFHLSTSVQSYTIRIGGKELNCCIRRHVVRSPIAAPNKQKLCNRNESEWGL